MFEIVNNTNKEIEELNYLNEYINFIVKKEKLSNCIFNIIFVSNDEIHKINLEYRGIDRVTDVISFALEDNSDVEIPEFRVLGDIYIAIDVAYEQAKMYGHSSTREICFLATHGILHLLGYDHMDEDEEKIMFKKQKELLDNYEITR